MHWQRRLHRFEYQAELPWLTGARPETPALALVAARSEDLLGHIFHLLTLEAGIPDAAH
jgi:hypothetical protein